MARSNDQSNHKLSQQRFNKPAGSKLFRRSVEHEQQRRKRQEVEDRADQTEQHQLVANECGIPAAWLRDPLRIHVVTCNRHGWYVRQEVVQQNLR